MLVGEALCYQEITNNKKYAWKISFYANAVSFIIGSIIFNLMSML